MGARPQHCLKVRYLPNQLATGSRQRTCRRTGRIPSSTSLSNSDCVSPAFDDFLHSTTCDAYQQFQPSRQFSTNKDIGSTKHSNCALTAYRGVPQTFSASRCVACILLHTYSHRLWAMSTLSYRLERKRDEAVAKLQHRRHQSCSYYDKSSNFHR